MKNCRAIDLILNMTCAKLKPFKHLVDNAKDFHAPFCMAYKQQRRAWLNAAAPG